MLGSSISNEERYGKKQVAVQRRRKIICKKQMHDGRAILRRHCLAILPNMAGNVAGLPMTAQGHCVNTLRGSTVLRCSHRQTKAAIMCLRHVSHNVSYMKHYDTYEERAISAGNADTTSFAALCLRGKGSNIKRSGAHNSLDASEKKVRSAHIILVREFYHLRVSTERVGRRTPELERIRVTYFSWEGSDIYSPVPARHRTASM